MVESCFIKTKSRLILTDTVRLIKIFASNTGIECYDWISEMYLLTSYEWFDIAT